jgi:hypothetical protein
VRSPNLNSWFLLSLLDLFLNVVSWEEHCLKAYISRESGPWCRDPERINLPSNIWSLSKIIL